MKFAAYSQEGRVSWGVVASSGIVDGPSLTAGEIPCLAAALRLDARRRIRRCLEGWAGPVTPWAGVTLEKPSGGASKLICVGLNYLNHVQEVQRSAAADPAIFLRCQESVVGPDMPIELPAVSSELDYEGELAVVIGEPGFRIPADRAAAHIAGYTCFNDGSVRNFQRHSVTAGKNFRRSGALGPWIAVVEEGGTALHDALLTTRLDGLVVQQSMTGAVLHAIPELIAYVSQIMPLEPGDLIATGTPEGVGMSFQPPRWLKAAQTIEVEIEGVGTLRNTVCQARD